MKSLWDAVEYSSLVSPTDMSVKTICRSSITVIVQHALNGSLAVLIAQGFVYMCGLVQFVLLTYFYTVLPKWTVYYEGKFL